MRKALSISLVLAVALAGAAFAKPVDTSNSFDRFQYLDLQNPGSDVKTVSSLGVFGSAQQDTTYFGGTFWAADSSRWEAIEDSVWTFDTGVGSDFNNFTPDVNPFKNPSLHTHMEGWVGIDNSYGGVNPYFRRLTTADPGWKTTGTPEVCVGTNNGLGGSASFWCGVLQSESAEACFAAGQGYGNSWNVSVEKTFAYSGAGGVNLQYNFTNDTEPGFDYSYVVIDTSAAGDFVVVASYDGFVGATGASVNLTEGVDMRTDAGNFKVIFQFVADGAYSDEDGLYPSFCGAFAFDDVALSGGATYGPQGFEAGADGWALAAPTVGQGGDWSDIRDLSTLPGFLTPCTCALDDMVLTFTDPTQVGGNGHNQFKDNIAASPWIDLLAAGLAGSPFKFIQTHVYAELPLLNYIFAQFNMQWYPTVCSQNGKLKTSAFESNGFVYYFGGIPQCTTSPTTPTRITGFPIDPGAEQVRIAVGALSYCRFFANCTQQSNHTPIYDYVKFAVFGSPDAPYIAISSVDLPQDSFPQNGTLRIDASGRLDCNNIKGETSPEVGSAQGDTLIVDGGTGGSEVRVQFAVDPGPYIAAGGPNNAAFVSWLTSHQAENVWYGQQWYSARMDTMEQGGTLPADLGFMTAYHESDPNFSGTDSDVAGDLDPNGNPRLANDIFPDDLFTAGTRVNLFFKAQYDGSITPFNGAWYTVPDTSAGGYYEMEVLPSSMAADSTWNCVLYVDHFNRGAQAPIETGLASVIAGTSANFEQTPWDRFDVNAESSQQGSVGGPTGTQYGMRVDQAFGYDVIIWSSGNLNSFNLVEEDANVLIPWLATADPGGLQGLSGNNFYGSGDGLAQSMTQEQASEPSATALLNNYLGAVFNCGTIRDAACGNAGSPVVQELTDCIPVAGTGAPFANSLNPASVIGNGCPLLRSFDLLTLAGGGEVGNERYNTPNKGLLEWASIANDYDDGFVAYRSVIDGASVHYRVDSGTCTDTQSLVTERLDAVLDWFGFGTSQVDCIDVAAAAGVGDDIVRDTKFKTALANFAPNPLIGAAEGRIQFTMSKEGRAALDIFDVNGRLVKTVFDGIASEGVNEAFWNGTGEDGRPVASGVFFYRLRADGKELAKKLVVVRNGN